ncbi:MAG: hypothetical protein QCH35_11250 [Methanomicrobiaceae archaeon]|nr:hypothetical protein [Methanomicrobiaceae archaeon]
MASRADRILARLPHFYNRWDRDTALVSLIRAFGTPLEAMEGDLVRITRAHWINTAWREDLVHLGGIYGLPPYLRESDDEYRIRLKLAIESHLGGGTVGSIQRLVRTALKLAPDHAVEIMENPRRRLERAWVVSVDEPWMIDACTVSAEETVPEITITVRETNGKIFYPSIVNLTTGESIGYKESLKAGDVLSLREGRGVLNGEDVTDSLTTTRMPRLSRGQSRWELQMWAGSGRFDGEGSNSMFNMAVFSIEATLNIDFAWTAELPATFEVVLDEGMLPRGVNGGECEEALRLVRRLVDAGKSAGVHARVTVREPAQTPGMKGASVVNEEGNEQDTGVETHGV